LIRIIETHHFEDIDHDAGYEYIGDEYTIDANGQTIYVRKYCGEDQASITKPLCIDVNSSIALFEFIRENLLVSKIEVYVSELGCYRPVDFP